MMATATQTDKRLEKVETVNIDFETFKKAFRRNYLEPDRTMFEQNHTFVLRLYPPFEAEMDAEYYESAQGRHYNSEWDEKPHHTRPELLILEGYDGMFNLDWPTEQNTRQHFTDEEIEEEGGIDVVVKKSREMFWDEIQYYLPDEFALGISTGVQRHPVTVEWKNV